MNFPSQPTLSVVIPTHNRREAVTRALGALSKQVYPAAEFEVIIVADGCTDDTVFFLQKQLSSYPFMIRILEQQGMGPAAARNAGARHAQGQTLIFMDDDIEPLPSFVGAHCNAHNKPRRVVMGPCPPRLTKQKGFFRHALQGWWEVMFDRMRQPGYRFSYTDLLSGNLSLSRSLFMEVGGFDPRFICHEDYELGVRLLQAETEFVFEPSAKGYHHEMSDLRRSLERKFQEGKADVALGELYPQLCSTLPMHLLFRKVFLASRIMLFLAFYLSWAGDRISRLVETLLSFAEGAKIRRVWRHLLKGLHGYWYLRGVAQELPHFGAIRHYLLERPAVIADALEVNLADGIAQVKQQIDEKQPMNLIIYYGTTEIGKITQPGRERLRGKHLYHILRHELKAHTLRALAQANDLDIPVERETLIEKCDEFIAFQEKHGYAPS